MQNVILIINDLYKFTESIYNDLMIKINLKYAKAYNYIGFILDVLAAAHAENGRYDEAAATARKGLKLALRDGPEELAVGLTKRLEFYQAGHPYRQIHMINNKPKNHE